MNQKFYEKVLPTQGVYCVTTIDSNKSAHNQFAESLSELFTLIEEGRSDNKNVFVALSSFNNYSRKSDNAAFCRSFFIDLDVGAKGYPTKDDAKQALDRFIQESDLPPPVIVDSGNGIHAYWAFDSDIPADRWKPYAKLFKKFCLDKIMIDPAVTADAARIMRCPDTENHKSDPPKTTFIISDESELYDFDMFAEFLGEPEFTVEDVLQSAEKGLDEETLKFKRQDNYITLFENIAIRSLEGDGCEQIKYALENPQDTSYYEWYSTLSIARACDDWEEAIHKVSEDYSGYNRDKTIWKANETAGKPWSCETFSSHWPLRCQTCKFKGKFTNPLILGRELKQAPAVEAVEEVVESLDKDVVPPFPKFIEPYVRGQSGGIFFKPPPTRDDEGGVVHQAPTLICNFDLWPVKRMYSRVDGECLLVRYKLPHDPHRDTVVPTGYFKALDKFSERLGSLGVVLPDQKLWAKVADYMSKWALYMQNVSEAEQIRPQLGFTEDYKSFVVGAVEIREDGSEVSTAESPYVRNISRLMCRTGDYEAWKWSANMLNTPGLEIHAFTMFCGFGSPFMRLTSTSGASISLTGNSGCAKTGALYAAISIWGNPKDLSVFKSTDNGFIGRYLGLHNIPFGLDEATEKDPKHLSDLIHQISHGKAKIRMQSSVNAERDIELSASLIGIFTTNTALIQKLKLHKAAPEGEIARLIEFHLRKPTLFEENPSIPEKIFDVFRVNYGYAGIEFIKYYYSVGEAYMQELVNKWQERTKLTFGRNNIYRFYHNLVGAAFASAELACEAGIIKMDLDRIFNKVISELIKIRDNTANLNDIDYEGLVAEYVMKNHSGLLIMDDSKVISDPKAALIGRIDVGSQTQYIARTPFNKYLADLQVSPDDFVHVMRSRGLLLDTESGDKKRRLDTGWKSGLKLPSVRVYTLKTEIPEDFFDGSKQQS